MEHLRSYIVAAALALLARGLSAQGLPPEVLDAVRRGAAERVLPSAGTTVPLVGTPLVPLVEVELNGKGPYRFLVDLGSNVVILRRDIAQAAGLEFIVEREGSDIVRADSLRLGRALFLDVYQGSYDELDVDGVIGYNLLKGSGLAVDYRARTLEIGPGAFEANDGSLPLREIGRMPYVSARIGNREFLLNFDTGAANWIVMPASWADSVPLAAPPVEGPLLFNNQTGAVRVWIGTLAEDLIVGPHVIRRPVVFFDPEVEDAWLGSAILAESRLELDTQGMRARIQAREPLRAPPFRTLGLSLDPIVAERAYRLLDDVIPGTPAASLPLAVGDTVVSIGELAPDQATSSALRELVMDNESVAIRILRGGDTLTVEVPVAELGGVAEVRGAASEGLLPTLADLRRRFSEAYTAHLGASVAEFYEEGGRLLPPGRFLQGRAAIADYFTPPPDLEIVHHAMVPAVLWPADDTVVEEGRWSMAFHSPRSGWAGGAGRYVVLWRRDEHGSWRLALDMWHAE